MPRPSFVTWATWAVVLGAVPAALPVQTPGGAELDKALATHPYFSHLALARDATHEPYLFLLQKSGSDASPAAKSVPALVTALDSVLARFEGSIARPLALEPRAGHDRFVVVVLASRGDLENYQRVTRATGHLNARAFYDETLDAAILYEDSFQSGRSSSELERSARHALVHACQQAWYAGGAHAPVSSWLMEGMADALAAPSADDDVMRPDPDSLRGMVSDALDERRAFANLRTLGELFLISEPARLGAFFQKETPPALRAAGALDTSQSGWTFYRESTLVFDFLWTRHRPEFQAFLGDALAGRGTMASFQARFPGRAPPALEAEFLDWLLERHHSAFPVEKPERELVLGALRRGDGPPSEPPPPRLSLDDATPEERLALAIHRLGHGAEDAAADALAALAAEPLEAALHERVLAEQRRLELWREVRSAYLAGLVASGAPLEFQRDGKTLKVKVLAIDGNQLVLDKNRAGVERLAVAELDALALAQAIRPAGGAHDWARLLPYVLREDPRARKLLKDDGGEAGALWRDARDDYPARLRLGAAMARLTALAAAPEPTTPAEIEARLGELAAVRKELGELPLVQRKQAELHALARGLLQQKYAQADVHTLLNGKLDVLADGNVRITYDLASSRLLDDFEASLYPVLMSKGFPPVTAPDEAFHVANGELVARGHAGLRSLYDLGAPLSVHYGLAYGEAPDQGANDAFALACADDGHEHFVWGIGFSALQCVEDSVTTVEDPMRYYGSAFYAMELRHDGTRVTLACEGKAISIAAGSRASGALVLRVNSDDLVRVNKLVIEGHVLADSFARLRRERAERELQSF